MSLSLSCSGFGINSSFGNGNSYNPATGSFEIQNVIPGAYTVQAQMAQTTTATPRTPGDAAGIQERQLEQLMRPSAEASIVVGNADVENVLLTLTTGLSVPGKLRIEDQNSTTFPFAQTPILLYKLVAGAISNIGIQPSVPSVNADGTFQFVGLRPGQYTAIIAGFPVGYYVKSLKFDDRDILGKPLEFSGSTGSGMIIVLGAKPGEVQGSVTDAKIQPAIGAQAVLIPSGLSGDVQRSRTDLYKTAVVNERGQFVFMGVAPGDYKVFAWESIEQFQYFDPEFLKLYEVKGQAVHVGESAKSIADVQLITVAPQ